LVLSSAAGGTVRGRASRLPGEQGSQSLEFALAFPFVVLAVVVVLHGGLLAADVVTAQAVALQAARVAATDDDEAVRRAVATAAGDRPVEVEVVPPAAQRVRGEQVVADIRLRSAAFASFGAETWIPARVSMRVERP
jgi:hypothetical protein